MMTVGGMLADIGKSGQFQINSEEDISVNKLPVILCLVFISIFQTGCGGTGEISYSPPGIPVKVSIDTNGHIDVGLSTSLCTPIGVFELGYDTTVASLRDKYGGRVLVVRVDDEASIYQLTEGQEFKISFDDDNKLYKKVALIYETDGDIVLELESVPQYSTDGMSNNDGTSTSENARRQTVSCPGAKYPTLLQPDNDASVCTKVDRVIIRKSASMSASEVLSIYPGTTIKVLEGPVCADDFWWWKVEIYPGTTYGLQTNGYDPLGTTDRSYYGWVREGWDEKDDYFVCQ